MNGYIGTRPLAVRDKRADQEEDQMATVANVTAPKVGEHVTTEQMEGVYEVAGINSLMQTANLKSTDGQGHITRNVPWTSLKPAARK
jgi:hypothetical protein